MNPVRHSDEKCECGCFAACPREPVLMAWSVCLVLVEFSTTSGCCTPWAPVAQSHRMTRSLGTLMMMWRHAPTECERIPSQTPPSTRPTEFPARCPHISSSLGFEPLPRRFFELCAPLLYMRLRLRLRAFSVSERCLALRGFRGACLLRQTRHLIVIRLQQNPQSKSEKDCS